MESKSFEICWLRTNVNKDRMLYITVSNLEQIKIVGVFPAPKYSK